MGVETRLVLWAESQEQAETAAKAAYARYAELEQVMSSYRPSSEVSQLAAKAGHGPQQVSDDLWNVLAEAQRLSRISGGAFDVTAGPLFGFWRELRGKPEPSLPEPKSLLEMVESVGHRNLAMHLDPRRVEIAKEGITIDLGGIGKGYANAEALKVLAANGIESALAEAGGDIAVSGPPPEQLGWTISTPGRTKPFVLKHAAISTSGDLEQFVEIDGMRYSHVVDPRTGMGVTSRILVTVVGTDAAQVDGLATACTVLGEEAANRVLALYRCQGFFRIAE